MISKQVQEVNKWWVKVRTESNLPTLEEIRDFNENWGALTAEPREVDYIETVANGVGAMWLVPHGCNTGRVLLACHGGGYFSGSIYTHRKLFAHFAKRIGCRALIVDYRQPPEHQHPAPVNDCVTAYQWLLSQDIQPQHIAFVGDSAGGGLAVATMLLARDKGLPLPAASMPFSPWFDMELSGETYSTNDGNDLIFSRDSNKELVNMFLGEKGNRKDPYASPLYGDLKGLPPVYLQVGDQELLLDDSRMMADRLKKSGVDVQLDIFPGLQHTWHMAAGRAPESDKAIDRYVAWVKPKLGL